jgi:orotate phosphoribosyltransferase
MDLNIEIRPFTHADQAGVTLLWGEVFPNDPPWNDPAELIRRNLAVQPELFFVAHTNGRIIGTVLAGFDGVRGWIYHLAVEPAARRKGIASSLMKAAEAALRRQGCPKVNLQVRGENAAVVTFYRTLGYETEDRTSMGKRLPPQEATRETLAQTLLRTCLLNGNYQLRSGQVAKEYFDKYRFESDPRILQTVAEAMLPLIPTGAEVLAGLELGGVPLATALSRVTGIPARFVRKTAKSYGTRDLVEGGAIVGRRLVIIEDVITSGGQVLESAPKLKEVGAKILAVLCVVDREAGGAATLAAAGLELRSLFTFSELRRLADLETPSP